MSKARTWLAKRCPVVITEITTGAREEPDAIGWRGAGSILVECKASRADLRADKDKPHRRREAMDRRQTASDPNGLQWPGLGDERYYLFPVGLVEVDDTLLLPDWGVLFATVQGKVRVARKAVVRQGDAAAERMLLVSCLRRLGVASDGGVSVKLYTLPTKCRASLTIDGGDQLVAPPVGGAA